MRARVLLSIAVTASVAMSAMAATSCGGTSFDSASVVNTVRILASSADKPYAKPGDQVTVSLLAYDGRPDAGSNEPMTISWLPIVCTDPADDVYYNCFNAAALGDGGSLTSADGGAMSGFGGLQPGINLTPLLPSGPTYSFQMSSTVISSHAPPQASGSTDPYGIVILFNAACAGHLELIPTSSNPQSFPIGCFDSNHNLVSPDDYVFGLTRVYAYNDRTNANPVISQVTFAGNAVDPSQGVTIKSCAGASCTEVDVDTSVPPSSQEPNPSDIGSDGTERNEQIYVSYFATGGKFDDDVRLLYDPVEGKISGTSTKFAPPGAPGEGVIWAVVHDNRGGASWEQIPMHVQ